MLAWSRLLFMFVAGALAWPASDAHAYCRESISSDSMGPCVDSPHPLFWTRGCLTYTFNDQLFSRLPLMTEKETRDGFNESFNTWRAVDCGDGPSPFYVEQASGTTTNDKSAFDYDIPNESVIDARTREEWSALGHDPNALALTLLWHDKDTGEILDVDMELNTGAGRFTNCDRPCGRDMMDLRNTITHEAGHVLGLGHSPVPGSTMLVDAPDGETEKRSLEADDKAGYCALALPQFECSNSACTCPAPPIYPSKRTVKGCACNVAGGHEHAPLGLFAMLGGLVLFRARRKSLSR
jgi:hypothetical protein